MSRLVVLAGPSGVGKGTVVAELRRLLPALWMSVSVTTRAPREDEVPGRDYLFVSRTEFDAMVNNAELLEYAEYAGNSYGTPRGPVESALDQDLPALLEIELEGARQVRAILGERAWLVMLVPPSPEELERRLTGRGTENAGAVARRLERAHEELAAAGEFDQVIVNTDVGESARRLLSLFEIL